MKKNKVLFAVLTASAAAILCSVNASAKDKEPSAPVSAVTEITTALTGKTTVTTVSTSKTKAATASTSKTKVTTVSTTSTSASITTEEVPDLSGWSEQDGKKLYLDAKGKKLTGYQVIDDKEYYFAANGTAKSGFYTIDNVRMYFSPETFERQLGWVEHGSSTYYLDEKGKAEGRQTINDKDYLFDSQGVCMLGWFEYENSKYYCDIKNGIYTNKAVIDKKVYYFSAKGRFKSGWVDADGTRIFYDYDTASPVYGWINYNGNIYYCSEENGKLTGDTKAEGLTYRFSDSGCLQTGMQKFSDGIRYYDNNGKPHNGFTSVDGKTYYFDEDSYVMKTGLQTIGGKKYGFDDKGIMLTGFQTLSGKKYCFDKNGVMLTGWQTLSGKKYYFDNDGVMYTGIKPIDGKKYGFDNDGVMLTGFQSLDGKNYYFDKNGVMATGQKVIDGTKYYFDEKTGVMKSGWQTIKGEKYYLKDNGTMAKGEVITIDGKKQAFSGSGAWLGDKSSTFISAYELAIDYVKENTKSSMSKEEKLWTCFSLFGDNFRERNPWLPHYTEMDWVDKYAENCLRTRIGNCLSFAAAFGVMARVIGYDDVYGLNSGGHGWIEIDGLVYDPEWAKSHGLQSYFARSLYAGDGPNYAGAIASRSGNTWQCRKI